MAQNEFTTFWMKVADTKQKQEPALSHRADDATTPLLFGVGLGLLIGVVMTRLVMGIKADISEARRSEAEEAEKKAEEQREKLRQKERESRREEEDLDRDLDSAAWHFNLATKYYWRELGERDRKPISVEDAISVIPELVYARKLDVEKARLLEANVCRLALVGTELGTELVTKSKEGKRNAYLDATDGVSPA
jgi:hypothetical protein